MEIILLIMLKLGKIMENSWNCAFEFLWEPCLKESLVYKGLIVLENICYCAHWKFMKCSK